MLESKHMCNMITFVMLHISALPLCTDDEFNHPFSLMVHILKRLNKLQITFSINIAATLSISE